MSKAKKLFKNWRVIILIIFLVLAVIAIRPNPEADGVVIRSVAKNSSAMIAGIEGPKPSATPMSKEVILSMNNVPIDTEKDYFDFVSDLKPDYGITIKTNKGFYKLTTKPLVEIIPLNETEMVTVNETVQVNETINGTLTLVNKTVETEKEIQKVERNVIGTQDIGLKVAKAPTSNIRKGLDLEGGTRVLLQPESEVSDDDMELIMSNLKERLNVFGLTDVVVRKTKDLVGNQYILVEIAGANEEEVKELLAKQGKFEAKVGNITVFRGGDDVKFVCRSADCSGIDPRAGCGQGEDGSVFCRFRFSISLSPEAAQVQADTTANLDVITEDGEPYLSEKLSLYLDDEMVDELNIGAELQGRPVTDIAISGSGAGATRDVAVTDALQNMKRLQTILITGSLPVKLNIVKSDAISPTLGEEFIRNALLVGILAILAVSFVVYMRYRKLRISLPMMATMISEVILLLGLAALVGWNLDLAAIAGIIVAAGTGVDDQIVIADEVMRGRKVKMELSWKEKIKKAFFIIMAAYFTTVVAMVPLLFAGAGLIKGFALTTIAGVSFGVFLTRPAFAAIVEILMRK